MRSAKPLPPCAFPGNPAVMHRSRAPIPAPVKATWGSRFQGAWKKLAERLDRGTGWAATLCMIPWPSPKMQLYSLVHANLALWALGFTLAFAFTARWLRAVTVSGAIAGGILAFLLFVAAGPGAFVALIVVFLLTWTTTRIGHQRKRQLGTAEKRGGRSASQVVANIGVAAAAVLVGLLTRHSAGLVACSAALAEAAADTTSSEVGQAASDSAYLITSFRPVPVGTDGGISFAGTLAGIAAAAVVAAVCCVTGMIARSSLLPVAAAGVLGMIVDSFLGATLERQRLLNNDAVNLLSTIAAALFALFLYWSSPGQFPLP